MSKFRYQVSVQKIGIRYPIANFEVSGIGFRIDLKYRVSDTQKKTRYLAPE